MATHSSTLDWKVTWTEEPGRLRSMGSLGVGCDWATSLSLFTFHFHALEKEMATHSSVLAWKIPGTGEPSGLPSMGLHRVGHNWSDLAAACLILYKTTCWRRSERTWPIPLIPSQPWNIGSAHGYVLGDTSRVQPWESNVLPDWIHERTLLKPLYKLWDFEGDFLSGPVDKNPPANAGDTGSIPGPGRFHMPWSNKAHVPWLWSLPAATTEPVLWSPRAATKKPMCHNYWSLCALEQLLHCERSYHNEKLMHRNKE